MKLEPGNRDRTGEIGLESQTDISFLVIRRKEKDVASTVRIFYLIYVINYYLLPTILR